LLYTEVELVGVRNEQFNSIRMHGINTVKLKKYRTSVRCGALGEIHKHTHTHTHTNTHTHKHTHTNTHTHKHTHTQTHTHTNTHTHTHTRKGMFVPRLLFRQKYTFICVSEVLLRDGSVGCDTMQNGMVYGRSEETCCHHLQNGKGVHLPPHRQVIYEN
jgi:hypothetical protein